MALTLGTSARNASVDARVDLIDAGSGAGKVKILTSGDALLCTITLADPAFGSASSGSASASGLPKSATASGTGTAAKYQVTDSDDNVIWSGTCSASGGGGDMILDSTSITSGQTVAITSWAHAQSAT